MAAPIITCIVAVCFGVFCLSKTTLRRRVGFWRETARPFLLMLLASAMGISIVMITPAGTRALAWHEVRSTSIVDGLLAQSMAEPRPPGSAYDPFRNALVRTQAPFIVGLVSFSVAFLTVLVARGKRRLTAPPAQPFFISDGSGHPGAGTLPRRSASPEEVGQPV